MSLDNGHLKWKKEDIFMSFIKRGMVAGTERVKYSVYMFG